MIKKIFSYIKQRPLVRHHGDPHGEKLRACEIHVSLPKKNWCKRWLSKFPTRSKRIDVISRIFFPLMFALFNLVYWTTYLFREDMQDFWIYVYQNTDENQIRSLLFNEGNKKSKIIVKSFQNSLLYHINHQKSRTTLNLIIDFLVLISLFCCENGKFSNFKYSDLENRKKIHHLRHTLILSQVYIIDICV